MNGPFGLGGTALAAAPGESGEDDARASLLAQLQALYQEKEELQAALGLSTASEIIEYVRGQQEQTMLASLTDQLHALYSERVELQNSLGCSDADEILGLVGALRASVRSLIDDSRRRLDYEASLLSTHERFLA